MNTKYTKVYKYFTQQQIADAIGITVHSFRKSSRKDKYLSFILRVIDKIEQDIINKIKQ